MSFTNLIKEFTTNSWIPMCKVLVPLMKTADKSIPNFLSYMNAKKFAQMQKVELSSITDKNRYDVLMDVFVEFLKTKIDTFEKFLTDVDDFMVELIVFLKSDNIYETVKENFTKGAFGKMIDDLNRVLNPKKSSDDDDETEDPTEKLKTLVKQFSLDFEKLLTEHIDNGAYLYMTTHLIDNVGDTLLDISDDNISVFSLYNAKETNSIALWLSYNDSLEKYFKDIDSIDTTLNMSVYMNHVMSNTFVLNPKHYTNLDTLKRYFTSKDFGMFSRHLNLLKLSNTFYFYKSSYKHNDDFNDYDELKLRNAITSFPNNFEDYAKTTMTLFEFTQTKPINITGYWLLSNEFDKVISLSDRELFDFTVLDTETYIQEISKLESNDDVVVSMVHG